MSLLPQSPNVHIGTGAPGVEETWTAHTEFIRRSAWAMLFA
jgi:hypothetical protein